MPSQQKFGLVDRNRHFLTPSQNPSPPHLVHVVIEWPLIEICTSGATIDDPWECMKEYNDKLKNEDGCDMVLPLCHLYEIQDERYGNTVCGVSQSGIQNSFFNIFQSGMIARQQNLSQFLINKHYLYEKCQ